MGRATPLLSWKRTALAVFFLALLALYYGVCQLVPDLSEPGDALWFYFGLTALVFAPVYFGLGLRNRIAAVWLAIVAALCAIVLYRSGATLAASVPKLVAAALAGFLFLRLCENLWLLLAVALIAPAVDTLSVWRGPTNKILTEAPQVFDAFSIALPYPGERTVTLRWDAPRDRGVSGYLVYRRRDGGRERLLTKRLYCTAADDCGSSIVFANGAQPAAADAVYRVLSVSRSGQTGQALARVPAAGKGEAEASAGSGPLAPGNPSAETAPFAAGLGLSDVIFFALFAAGAARFGLRPRASWLALVASLALTGLAADYGDFFHLNGLPAIPGLALAFVLVNGDLIWKHLREREEIDLDYEPKPVPLPRR